MNKLTKAQQRKITKVIEGFRLDGKTDYTRMRESLLDTGIQLDHKALWACVNRARDSVPRTAYDMGWLLRK